MTGRYHETSFPEAASGAEAGEFILRKRPFILTLAGMLLLAFSALAVAGMGLHEGIMGQTVFALTVVLILVVFGGFIAIFTQRQRDLVMVAEFQNMMLSSAIQVNSHFCLILRKDGSIVYLDPGFQRLFPQLPYRSLQEISKLAEAGIIERNVLQIFDQAIGETTPTSQVVELSLPNHETIKTVLTLEPLSRPSGYFLLRGRPFISRQEPHASGERAVYSSLPSHPQAAGALSLEALIAHSPLAIAQLDADGQVIQCNEVFRTLTDRTRYRKEGWNFLEAIVPADRTVVAETLRHFSAPMTQENPPLEITLLAGKDRSAALYLTPMQVEGNDNPLFLVYLLDTTEQKNLELRYAHSQKMQAVGQLAGGVAHDFNNLLTAMIGFCDLLLMRHPAGDQSFADIMQIKQNANRAANLVRQLLAFSRRQTLQPKLLDITEVLAELSNLIRRLIGESVELKMIHGRDMGMVKADQGQLEQVFVNLAVNARDAMGSSGTLTLRTAVVKLNGPRDLDASLVAPSADDQIVAGEYALVEIADTGTGIAPENIQKIFEPFFSTKEVGAGTGLGLATVYGIIKQTGGYLYVSSTVGVGTKFRIYFPRYEASAVDNAAPQPEEKNEKEPTGDLTGTGTILLVEDEAPVRSFASRALRNKGYTVYEADCGDAALEVIAEHGAEINIVVSDVIMPGMNGPEMIKRILPEYPQLKVIFISGYAEDAFADSFGEDYEINFLPKPFTLKQLASKVKEVLQER
jgi:signal transduction histidine kinase